MPPRYAYWTILIGDEPTAFRSGSQEELMPTFNRLQQKHASAKMMWWQNGKLWTSRIDAQEAMRARGEIGRSRDVRQRPAERYSDRAPGSRERREERNPSGKLDWKPKGKAGGPPKERSAKPEWKPKGSFTPEPQKFAAEGRESRRSAKREGGPEWKPKGSFKPERSTKPGWKPKSFGQSSAAEGRGPRRSANREGGPEWKPKGSFKPERSAKPEWKPKTSSPQDLKPSGSERRKWIPKAEYKKSLGIEAKKDKNWRPGGEHKDPRQKYKDAKKAKWGRFKQTVRKRWEAKGKKDDK